MLLLKGLSLLALSFSLDPFSVESSLSNVSNNSAHSQTFQNIARANPGIEIQYNDLESLLELLANRFNITIGLEQDFNRFPPSENENQKDRHRTFTFAKNDLTTVLNNITRLYPIYRWEIHQGRVVFFLKGYSESLLNIKVSKQSIRLWGVLEKRSELCNVKELEEHLVSKGLICASNAIISPSNLKERGKFLAIPAGHMWQVLGRMTKRGHLWSVVRDESFLFVQF